MSGAQLERKSEPARHTSETSDSVLWVGGVFTEQATMRNSAVSPAANRWQAGLLAAVRRAGVRVTLLSVAPQRVWPYGRLFPGMPGDCAKGFETVIARYCNIAGIREISAAFALQREAKRLCLSGLRPRALITYNPTRDNILTGRYAQTKLRIPWVDLCADAYDPGPDWKTYPTGAERADGHIFLSAYAAATAPFRPVLHLDGGVDCMLKGNCPSPERKVVLYSGMLSKWGGIDLLLAAFSKMQTPGVELWVCGHGANEVLDHALKSDTRIRFYGLVSEEQLHQLSLQATVFVNPRPSSINGNNMNFPSKVLQYLRYGKPVVSTWTPGLSDDYRPHLYLVREETADGLVSTLDTALSVPSKDLAEYSQRVESFLLRAKLWDVQAERLISWLRSDVVATR